VVAAFRQAVDEIMAGKEPALTNLIALTEGHKETQGAFQGKSWR
jgi:putative protease